MCRRWPRISVLLFLLSLVLSPFVLGQPKPPEAKDQPKIVIAVPLAVKPGGTTRLTLRGLRLDAVTEVRCQHPKGSAKLVGKGEKVAVPNQQEPARVGDTKIDVEVTLPEDATTATLTVLTPAGESPPHLLLVDTADAIAEKEPNNGFKQAQLVTLPAAIDGAIGQAQDVDVFRFEGKAGQQVRIDIAAARFGSALEAILTLYNAQGQIVAVSDEVEKGKDPSLEATLPKEGSYYLSVLDANDQGGPAHVYRVSIRAK
jgi:hypothetical protein